MTRMFVLARAAVCACLVLTAAARAQEVLPIEYFTRSDELGTMKLSPDGEYLAITAGQHGGEFLTFVSLKDTKIGAAIQAPKGLEIHDFHWASNTRVVFQIAERQLGQVTPSPTGEIFAVDRDGGRQERIYGYRAGEMSTGTHRQVRKANYASAEIVSLLDGDDRNILIAEMQWREVGNYYYYNPDAKPLITRLDIYNGKEATVTRVPLSGADVIVDSDDVPRFAVGTSDGRQLSVAWKRSKDAEWEMFELPDFGEGSVKPLRFTPDNSAVLFAGIKDGQQYAALYQLTLADLSVKQLIDIPDANVRGLVTDFQNKEAIGVTGYTDKLVYRWLLPNHPTAVKHRALQKAFEGAEVRFLSRSTDGKVAIVFVDSDVAPGEYLHFNTQTNQATMIRAARSWVDLKKMRPRDPVKLTARDGLTLHGYVTRPAGAGPHPMIVLPHGGPHGVRDVWGYDWEAQLFANRGYAVLQVNFRGSGGYDAEFEEAGYREWGATMQDDLTDATKWAIEQKIASADRICIYGTSYGGYAALMGAAREPTLYRCAIGHAGIYDLPLMFESADIPESKMGVNYLNLVLGTDAADLRKRSPTSHAQSIQAPVMLIHGTEDWRADYKQAVMMKKALEKAGKQVEWLPLRREGHGVYDDTTRLKTYERILAFVDKHLKSAAAATASN